MIARNERYERIGLSALLILTLFIPAMAYRLVSVNLPMGDKHPLRQGQTLLTSQAFVRHGIEWKQYPTGPVEGRLWDFTLELPLYQAIVSLCTRATGFPLEPTAKGVTLFFFLLSWGLFTMTVRRFFDARTTWWATLLYGALPFFATFSTVSLIDPMALALTNGSMLLLALSISETKHRPAFLTSYVVVGTIAGLSKVTIWFIPSVVAIGLLVYHGVLLNKLPRRRVVGVGLLFLLQTILVASWVSWTGSLHPPEWNATDRLWLLGTFDQRLDVTSWKEIGLTVFRTVLQDWLVIPVLLAIWVGPSSVVIASIMIVLTSVVLLFNIHLRHDYYFLSSFPYLVLVSALGIERLLQMRNASLRWALIVVCAILYFHRLPNLYRDYRQAIVNAPAQTGDYRWLAEATSNDEVIETRFFHPEIAYHADRLIGFWDWGFRRDTFVRGEGNAFLANYHNGEAEFPSSIETSSPVWVGANSSKMALFRFRESAKFAFDSRRDLGVYQDAEASVALSRATQVDVCERPARFKIPPSFSRIRVVTENGQKILFPNRGTLNLVRQSWGCRFHVEPL